jgi:hypothetical protein
MEELANHGYVIFSIAHPYEALVVVYPDGRITPVSETQMKAFAFDSGKALNTVGDRYREVTDPKIQEQLIRQYLTLLPSSQSSMNIWTYDTLFCLNTIGRLNQGEIRSPLTGRLDLERTGVFGHSFGGATAGQACILDRRFKAGVNMDGMQYGDVLDRSLTQPFMMMYSADWSIMTNNAGETINDVIYNMACNEFYRVMIKNTGHFNYSDFSMISPLFKAVGFMGDIDGYRMETIMNRYLLAFFDKHLKGIESPLLNGQAPDLPEVDFRVRNQWAGY